MRVKSQSYGFKLHFKLWMETSIEKCTWHESCHIGFCITVIKIAYIAVKAELKRLIGTLSN